MPVLVAGLNIWNFINSLDKARNDGIFSEDELRTIGANAAYTANALMALWTVPAWNKWANMQGTLRTRTTQLAKAGASTWLKAGSTEFSVLARQLVLRTMEYGRIRCYRCGGRSSGFQRMWIRPRVKPKKLH